MYSEDDPNFVDPKEKVPSEFDPKINDDNNFNYLDLELEWRKKFKKSSGKEEFVSSEKSGVGSRKWKSQYDLIWKYQLKWAARRCGTKRF